MAPALPGDGGVGMTMCPLSGTVTLCRGLQTADSRGRSCRVVWCLAVASGSPSSGPPPLTVQPRTTLAADSRADGHTAGAAGERGSNGCPVRGRLMRQ